MGTIHTRLRIVNETNTDIVSTSVSSTANYDWVHGTGPHRNFQNVFIGSGNKEERSEVLRKEAKHCPFNMTLYFRDGSQDTFRIHQKYVNGCCDGFNHMTRSHDIFYERDEGNCLKITIKNTEQQLQNEKAEQLKKEGEAAMRQQQFHTAMQKYEEALRLANQGHTIDSINAAKVAATTAQKEERATKLKKEADEAMKHGQFETANDKYEQALDSAQNSETTNQIKRSKAEALYQLALAAFQEAWDFEADMHRDRSNAAKNMFNQAKARFQAARNLANDSEVLHGLKLVDVKIEANRLFNEANELEKEAFAMVKAARESKIFNNYNAAQNKYKEANEKYKHAKEKFEEGLKMNDARFEVCIQITTECIQSVDEVIDDIDKAELKYNISQVNVEEGKNEKRTDEDEVSIRPDFQEQIDVVPS